MPRPQETVFKQICRTASTIRRIRACARRAHMFQPGGPAGRARARRTATIRRSCPPARANRSGSVRKPAGFARVVSQLPARGAGDNRPLKGRAARRGEIFADRLPPPRNSPQTDCGYAPCRQLYKSPAWFASVSGTQHARFWIGKGAVYCKAGEAPGRSASRYRPVPGKGG